MKTYEQLSKLLKMYRVLLIMSWILIIYASIVHVIDTNENTVLQKGVVKLIDMVDTDTVDILSLQERIAELEAANEQLIILSRDKK